ncbi:uncharacterized protein LOC107041978 [Diachasma alloeum]|uniref:uncharacterized protein LOC107041978 n=1 Tax=Diachasma alloeum TaxID=454923 RepID=UPI00073829C1|nr:uncharacterized protein LOC107041978 [Diachasma alloeum]
MRKAPFSTPRGNSSGGNRPGSGWKSLERRNSRGYGERNIFQVYPTNSSQEASGDDFIPFNSTPPSHHHRSSTPTAYYDRKSTPTSHERNKQNNFYGGRGGRNRSFGGSPGFYNDNRSPRGNSNSFSPYNNRRSHQRDHKSELTAMRSKAISEIIDLSLILEDPWKKLMSNLSKYTQEEDKNESNVSINSETMETSQQDSVIEDNQENDSFSGEKSRDSDD